MSSDLFSSLSSEINYAGGPVSAYGGGGYQSAPRPPVSMKVDEPDIYIDRNESRSPFPRH